VSRETQVRPEREALCEAAIGTHELGVDPTALGPGKKRYHVGDILGVAQAFQRGEFTQLVDLRLSLIVAEEFRRHRAWGYGIYGDVATTQLIGEHVARPSTPAFDAMYGPYVGKDFAKTLLVTRQPLCDSAPDAPRCACDNCNLAVLLHLTFLLSILLDCKIALKS
jgi:hypothetical protein